MILASQAPPDLAAINKIKENKQKKIESVSFLFMF